MFLDNFPRGYEPRDIQKDVIKEIESKINSGFTNILICAPTGIGKSHIAMTVARSLESSFVLTAQKILQDQYTKNFKWLYPVKGKSNFPCLALYNPKNTIYVNAMKDKNCLCNQGICSWIPKGQKARQYCEFKPDITKFTVSAEKTEDERVSAPDGMCFYYNQKFQALNASHAIFNYSSYFQTRRYGKNMSQFLERDCLIADEAHEIESEIIKFVGYDIRKKYLDDVGLKFNSYNIDDISSITKLVEDIGDRYVQDIRVMEESQNRDPRFAKYRNRLEKIDRILKELYAHSENMVVQEERAGGETTNVSIKPLEISGYVGEFFDYDHQIFLSATINKEMFCRNMGLNEENCAFIEIEKSPFPLANRPINFLDICDLNKNSSDNDWGKIYKHVDKLMKQHTNEKGLILTTSVDQCNKIFRNLSSESQKRIKIAHNGVDEEKDEILKEFEA